jgi:hypothetical protein
LLISGIALSPLTLWIVHRGQLTGLSRQIG